MERLTKKEENILEECLFCENSKEWHKKHHETKNKIWNKIIK